MALTKAPAELLNLDSGITITTADNTDQLTLLSTDADASQGPSMAFYRNSSSPADSDDMGNIYFYGENDNDEKIEYGRIRSIMLDASDGTEDSNIRFWTMAAGSLTDNLALAGGSVGIGVSAPDSKLHVKHAGGGFDEVARLTSVANSSGDGAFLGFHGNSTSKFYGFIGGYDIGTNEGGVKIGVGNGETAIADSMTKLTIDNDGHVTMPSQSAFLAIQSVAVNNIATDASDHNIGYGNEIIDQNSDYNNSTYTFTAPVTGRYQLQSLVYLSTVDADCTYIILRIKTSNRNYSAIMRPDFGADVDRFHLTNAVLADMDASDTAVCTISQYEGTAQMDAVNSTGYFSGYLVA